MVGFVVIAVIAAVTLSGGGSGGGTSTTTVTGTYVLNDYETAYADCVGQGGFGDIQPGLSVILYDESGKIIGSSALDSGLPNTDLGTCTYTYSIENVPTYQAQYAVEISADRGKVVFSNAEMVENDWTIETVLGT